MISINYRDGRPIYEQVFDNFRQLIISGVLPADYKMPSVRELATQLTINPNTIQRAYRQLEEAGYICSVPGKGSFVCDKSETVALRKRELLIKLAELCTELRACGASEKEMIDTVKESEKP